MSAIDVETREYLLSPDNLEVALDMADALAVLKLEIFQDFWKRVATLLQEHVAASGLGQSWRVELSSPIDASESYLALCPLERNEDCFSVCAECLTGRPNASYFGIARDRPVPTASRVEADTAVTIELQRKQFKSHDWWVGYKQFSAVVDSSLTFIVTDNRQVVRLNQDNRQDGQLARQVTQELWHLLEEHHSALEQMNARYPYTA